jgi:hypothetical protein
MYLNVELKTPAKDIFLFRSQVSQQRGTFGTHGDSISLLEDFVTKYYNDIVIEGS